MKYYARITEVCQRKVESIWGGNTQSDGERMV